jgi:uncharacterized protein YegL
MKKDFTLIVFLLDRSGSMISGIEDTMGGFNSFIEKQRAETKGDVRVTLVTFSDWYCSVYNMLPIKDVPVLTKEQYVTHGWTALVDSMCNSIDNTGRVLSSMSEAERPSRVIFVTITDGMENKSTQFSNDDLKQRITHQTDKYSWDFLYLGANQDSFQVAQQYGYTVPATYNWNYGTIPDTYYNLSKAVSSSVNTGKSIDLNVTNTGGDADGNP